MPVIFQKSGDATPMQEILINVSDIASRNSLTGLNNGSNNLYFKGTTDRSPEVVSSEFPFTVNFVDPCLSATIATKAISEKKIRQNESGSWTIDKFTDDVDASADYSAI